MLSHRQAATSRRKVLLGAAFLVAVVAAGLAFVLRISGNDSVVLTGGSSYVEGVSGTWQRVNPLFASANEVDADLTELVFAGLVRIGPDGQVLPDMAELPRITDDGRTYTFTLRKDLKWHDGQTVTSRDVAFTVRTLTSSDFGGDQALAEG
ncbi:MAG: ABC transporter substrate-binding protein, partial [Dehalococcoidia bacterium]